MNGNKKIPTLLFWRKKKHKINYKHTIETKQIELTNKSLS